jgi:pimeloyl-ACP methyl ester carboxylesterase
MSLKLSVNRTATLGFALLLVLGIIVLGAGSSILRRRYPPPGRLVSVDGHKLHLYCTGTGTPAIILESGLGTDWTSWRLVIPALSKITRVCVYDRAGYGWSEPGPKPRTASRLASELHSLLHNAGVPAPYVLVAHSFGAYDARIYAARFRSTLKGFVLVDPADEDEPPLSPSLGRRIHNLLPPSGLAGLARLWEGELAVPPELRDLPRAFRDRFMVGASYDEAAAELAERNSLDESEAEVRRMPLPSDLPLTVLTAPYIIAPGRSGVPTLRAFSGHIALQAALTRTSLRGKQIVAWDSGHSIQLDRPDLVIGAIREMVLN